MSLGSADKAFGTIAQQKGYVSAEVLAAKEGEVLARAAAGSPVALGDYLVEQLVLDKKKKEEIERVRARHGRACEACSKDTFLLPGESEATKPCDFCGGKLRPRLPGPAASRTAAPAAEIPKPAPAPVAPAPVAPAPVAPAPAPGQVPHASAPAPTSEDDFRDTSGPTPAAEIAKPKTSVFVVRKGKPPEAKPPEAKPPEAKPIPASQKRRQDTFIVGYEPPPPEPPKPVEPVAPGPAADSETSPDAALSPDAAPAGAPAAAPSTASPGRKVTFGPTDEEMAGLKAYRTDGTPEGAPAPGRQRVAIPGPTPLETLAIPRPPRPVLPLAGEVLQILGAPVRGSGLIFVTLGSLLLGAFGFMATHTMFPYSIFVGVGCSLVFVYLNAFVLKTANASTNGQFDLPDWPDWEEAVGSSWPWDESGSLGFRLLLVQLACFWPYLFCVIAVLLPAARRGAANVKTVGEFASGLASKASTRTGKSVASEVLYDAKDKEWRIGDRKGHWLVLCLLEKETGDDTGMDKLVRSMPKMLPGMMYLPANQPYDLERVAKALPEVDMAGVFIDPGLRYMRQYGLVPRAVQARPTQLPSSGGEEGHEDPTLEIGPNGERRSPIDINKLPLVGQSAAPPERGQGVPGVSLVLRTHDYKMPGALANAAALVPTIWIVDPQGVVRQELEGGCNDQQLYGTLKDFLAGGNGQVEPELLPLKVYGIDEPVFLPWLATLLWWVGVVYFPIGLLICTIFTSGFLAFRYPVGIVAIGKATKDYFLLVGLYVVTLGVASFIGFALSIALRNQGAAFGAALAVWVKAWLSLYASLVIAVGIGRFYVRHDRELDWLSVEESGASFDAAAWRPDGGSAPSEPAPTKPGASKPGAFKPAASRPGAFKPAPPRPAAAPRVATAAPKASTFGPPPEDTSPASEDPSFDGAPPPPPRSRTQDVETSGPLKVLALLNAIPRQVEIAVAVLGIVVGSIAVKAEMRSWSFDSAALEVNQKLGRMTIDAKPEILSELKREGYDVSADEVQLANLVKFGPDGSLIGVPQAYVTVNSPRAGYRHQVRFLAPRSWGKGGFEVIEDPQKIWPAPTGQDKLRYFFLFGGFVLGTLFAAKAFLVSRD